MSNDNSCEADPGNLVNDDIFTDKLTINPEAKLAYEDDDFATYFWTTCNSCNEFWGERRTRLWTVTKEETNGTRDIILWSLVVETKSSVEPNEPWEWKKKET